MPLRSQILKRLRVVPPVGFEDVALTALALRHVMAETEAVIRMQHPSGGWSEHPDVEESNAYHTGLALLALRPFAGPGAQGAVDRGLHWLSALHGRESHWLWRWKFRLFDRQVRFDSAKSGWPWVQGTVSWVAPTALAMLAIRAWRPGSPRLASGAGMLVDRACRRGGWNAGNSAAFGIDLDPHPDFTAMALLALRESDHAAKVLVQRSLDYLGARLTVSCSPYSLAWALMALAAYGRGEADQLRSRLELAIAQRIEAQPHRILALAALALENPAFTFSGVES